jgi:hypothetical protein
MFFHGAGVYLKVHQAFATANVFGGLTGCHFQHHWPASHSAILSVLWLAALLLMLFRSFFYSFLQINNNEIWLPETSE